MPLTGLNRITARPRGGVRKVELATASEWAARESAAPRSGWAFREDRAGYTEERVGGESLSPLVRHTLTMELPATPAARRAVDELISVASSEGVVAVVTMASGEVVVAGCSERFGVAYPLRPAGLESASGRTPADYPTITLTLECIDDAFN